MTIVLLAVIVAIVLGVAFRGGFARFGQPRPHRNGLLAFAVVALGASLAGDHPSVAVFWLLSGALALCVYARLNRGRPGLLLAASGLAVNAIVTIVNYGMPVSLDAADRAGVPPSRVQLDSDPLRKPLTSASVLPWLSESVPLALPFRPAVASPGDLLVAAGAAVFLFTGLTGRGRPRPTPPEKKEKRTRGKRKAAKEDAPTTDVPPQGGPPAVFDTASLEPIVGDEQRVPAVRPSRGATAVAAPAAAPSPFSSPRMSSESATEVAIVPVAAAAAVTTQDSRLEASPFSGSRARADKTYAPPVADKRDSESVADAHLIEDTVVMTKPAVADEPDTASTGGEPEAVEIPLRAQSDRSTTPRAGRGAKKSLPSERTPRQGSSRRIAGRYAAVNGSPAAVPVAVPAFSDRADVEGVRDDEPPTGVAQDSTSVPTSSAHLPDPMEGAAPPADQTAPPDDRTGPPAAWRI